MTQFKRTKSVIVGSLSFKNVETRYLKILSTIEESSFADKDGDDMQAAHVCRVLNLEDNQEYDLVCPTVMVMQLQEENVDYLNKCYEINVKLKPREGKRYRDVTMYEIEEPTNPAAAEDEQESAAPNTVDELNTNESSNDDELHGDGITY